MAGRRLAAQTRRGSACCQMACLGIASLLLLFYSLRDDVLTAVSSEKSKEELVATVTASTAVSNSSRDAAADGVTEGLSTEVAGRASKGDLADVPLSLASDDISGTTGSQATAGGNASSSVQLTRQADVGDQSGKAKTIHGNEATSSSTQAQTAEPTCGLSDGGEPVVCPGTSDNPCCRVGSGVCGHTFKECSCGKECMDYSAASEKKGGGHQVGRGCNSSGLLSTATRGEGSITRVAVLCVGQRRIFMRSVSELQLTPPMQENLKARKITKVFDSHRIHVLAPLYKHTGIQADYFLCVESLGKSIPPEITEAWAFAKTSQVGRVRACLQRVLRREAACNTTGVGGPRYSIFVRLRPDFLALSDIPDPRLAIDRTCVMARFRMAANIHGLTNEHLSMCFCADNCCGATVGVGAGYVLDDMLAVAPRQFAEALWTGTMGPKPVPTSWPHMSFQSFESDFTRFWLTQGVPVCPLPFRGLPMGSPLVRTHVASAGGCGYATGGKAISQTHCGPKLTHADKVHELTPGPFTPAVREGGKSKEKSARQRTM